ncbi:uncharacterized protein LOC132543715 [Ylistrum balloti]|uniref:uncharacterized protein LOC132543715 n=1 Tax=Ylistrum balloti TaxID=509963 RepID=UPI002905B2CE|nr:uncharacterized protein LOC132543715 [Ylistrum balloti]
MPRRRISNNERWQIIGMHNTGMSCREIGRQLNITHTVISRLIRKHVATGNVQDRQRSGRPRKTTARDDRMLLRLARQEPRSASQRPHVEAETNSCWTFFTSSYPTSSSHPETYPGPIAAVQHTARSEYSVMETCSLV